MEIGHDEEAKSDADDAKKFDVVVRTDAVGEVIANFLIENDASAASGENEEANDESAKTKFHRSIITDFWYFISRDLKKSGE